MSDFNVASLAIAERRSAVLEAGLAWLYETEQPAEAIDQHHGASSPHVDGRCYGFCPRGADRLPVVVVNVARPIYLPGGDVENPLGGPAEVAEVVAALADLGRLHVRTWNGEEGCVTASIQLADEAHPSLLAAVDRYLAGCPVHPGPLCSWDGCRWYPDGNRHVVRPSWPGVGVSDSENTQ